LLINNFDEDLPLFNNYIPDKLARQQQKILLSGLAAPCGVETVKRYIEHMSIADCFELLVPR
jgi:hypothetical protein